MRLESPPVVEVGIDFHLDPNPEKRPWDLPVAIPFVERFKERMPYIEVVRAEEIRIEKRSPQGVPEEISGKISLAHVRAHDEGQRARLEVGDDWVGYRLLRGGKEYPGFDSVLKEALEILSQYIAHFQPTAVRRASLTYLDIVRIPATASHGVELDDYFRLGVKLPEDPFGPLGAFAIRFVLSASPRSDRLELIFSTEPRTDGDSVRFRMRWQSLCEGVGSLDQVELRHRLSVAHGHLVRCFRESFTERGLQLFNPTGS